MSVIEARTTGPEQTRELAAVLSEVLVDGDLLVLTGDLGAGKTCFTQGLGAGLGIDDRLTSPTFTLANRYEGRLVLNHLDVYRLDGPGDAADLDLDTLLDDGVTVIEWGDRLGALLPSTRLDVHLTFPAITSEPVTPEACIDIGTADINAADIDTADINAADIDAEAAADRVRIIRFEGWSDRGLGTVLARWVP